MEELHGRRERFKTPGDDRMSRRVELSGTNSGRQTAEQLVGELSSWGGHAAPVRGAGCRRAALSCARAAARTPRDPWLAASSRAAYASGVPMRASALAAAERSALVRPG